MNQKTQHNNKNELSAKERIIETSIQMFLKKPYNEITTNHIAKEAHVSIGTLYYHFKRGKPEIVREIIRREFMDFLDESQFSNLTKDNIPAMLRNIIGKLIDQHKKNASLIYALGDAMYQDQEIFDELESLNVISHWNLVPLIEKKVLIHSKVKPKERKKLGTFLLLAIDGVIHRHTFQDFGATDEELIDFCTNLILNHLK